VSLWRQVFWCWSVWRRNITDTSGCGQRLDISGMRSFADSQGTNNHGIKNTKQPCRASKEPFPFLAAVNFPSHPAASPSGARGRWIQQILGLNNPAGLTSSGVSRDWTSQFNTRQVGRPSGDTIRHGARQAAVSLNYTIVELRVFPMVIELASEPARTRTSPASSTAEIPGVTYWHITLKVSGRIGPFHKDI